MPLPAIALTRYQALIGQDIGTSAWMTVDQQRIDAFADCTDDHQFIHVAPKLAAASAFGGTIAHGFLTLSLLSRFSVEAVPQVEGTVLQINAGFDRVRFLAPVPEGARIRARFKLAAVDMQPGSERLRSMFTVTVEIEGAARPAVVADWIVLSDLAPSTRFANSPSAAPR